MSNVNIDAGINEGIADIESGRCMELRHDNIKEVLSKPLSDWVNDSPNEKMIQGLRVHSGKT